MGFEYKFSEEIEEILEVIGINPDDSLITENTQLMDFTLGLPQNEEDEMVSRVYNYVGFEVSFSDYLIDVARKLYEIRHKEEPEKKHKSSRKSTPPPLRDMKEGHTPKNE